MEHTAEFLAEEERVRAEIDTFLAADRTIRFIETDYNFTCLSEFLDQHGLEVNAANLVFAYESLVKQDMLELVPFAQPIPAPEAEPAPPATAQPPAVVPAAPSKRPVIMYRNGQPITGDARSL
jgi:hypothetical protein